MTIEDIKQKVKEPEYDFLRTNEHLGENIILLGVSGSHAYGTNISTSDIDIRGVATHSKREILLGNGFEQVENHTTDTVIYSLNKIVKLLMNCNPNTIELLGLKPEHYILLTPIGQKLIDNRDMFLSQRAANSFGGYANAQLRRLQNKSARTPDSQRKYQNVLKSIENASHSFADRYAQFDSDALRLYLDQDNEGETKIYMDVSLNHYPLQDYNGLWSEMMTIQKEYDKAGQRNKNAILHDKLGKHMMHLVRLYLMAFDILEKGEINTYREKEHDLLMNIRSGKYLDENMEPTKEFNDMVDEFENRLQHAKEITELPKQPDRERIEDFLMRVNEQICAGE